MNYFINNDNEQVGGHGKPDSQFARRISVGKGGAVNAVAKYHAVQLARVGSKRHFVVS